MVICAVLGCSKRTDRDREFSFFRFPTVREKCSKFLKELQKDRRNLCIQRINRKNCTDVQARYARVCSSSHFISGEPCDIKDRNNPDWAPSLNLGHQKVKNINGTAARYERNLNRSTIKENASVLLEEKEEKEMEISLSPADIVPSTEEAENVIQINSTEIQSHKQFADFKAQI